MSKRIREHVRSNVVGYIALFFALSTGSAVALSGSNTVFTDDIVNDQVYSADVRNDTLSGGGLAAPDLRPGSVGTSEVAADALGSGDLAPSSVGTSEVASDSLGGGDINEASLDLAFDPIIIQRHEFDTTAPYFNTTTDWEVIEGGGADLIFDPTNSLIDLETQESPFTPGSVVVRGRRTASVGDGTLVLTTRLLDAYAETPSVYGDAQPRGLANGTSRDDAIEFVNAEPGPTRVACRTVSGGAVTETEVDIGQSVREPAVYEIVADPTAANFYVNGALVCTHTTNIPTTPLNIYFGTSDGGAGNVPVLIDWVSFARRA